MLRFKGLKIEPIFRFIGILLIVEGIFMSLSLPVAYHYQTGDFSAIALSCCITILFGLSFWFAFKHEKKIGIDVREGHIIVIISWITISIFGSLPYYFSGHFNSYTDCFFESISGFTTTGASIIKEVESLPKGLLLWRSITNWIGGIGIIVFTLIILPFLGLGNIQAFLSNLPGMGTEKLHPKITSTARRLIGIYIGLTILQSLFLYLGKMNLFESICNSLSTVATGGFSTRTNGYAEFSPYIQYVTIFFMIMAGTNFSLIYFALKRKFSTVYKNEEYKVYLSLVALTTAVLSIIIYSQNDLSAEAAFRNALFKASAIISTTGFTSDTSLFILPTGWFLILLFMIIGGCAGSTAGGLKIIRAYTLLKNTRTEYKRLLHPRAILPVKINGKSLSSKMVSDIMGFFFLYIITFSLGTLAMSMIGLNFESAIGAAASCLGNIGPGIKTVCISCEYAYIPTEGKWILSALMLMGRIELFSLMILMVKMFWKK